MSKRILIIDDQLLFAESLIYLIDSLGRDIECFAFNSVDQALAGLEAGQTFDLALIDYAMPTGNGIEGMRQLKAKRNDLPVAILSGHDDPAFVLEAVQAGAAGWLSKAMGGQSLVNALNLLLAGERFVPAALLERPEPNNLTRREQQVAALVSQGLTDKQIAADLGLEQGTVKVHVKSLLRKSGTQNRTQFALRHRR